MYNPYDPDLVRLRQQELRAEVSRGRTAKAARMARRERRALAGRSLDTDGLRPVKGPALPLRA